MVYGTLAFNQLKIFTLHNYSYKIKPQAFHISIFISLKNKQQVFHRTTKIVKDESRLKND